MADRRASFSTIHQVIRAVRGDIPPTAEALEAARKDLWLICDDLSRQRSKKLLDGFESHDVEDAAGRAAQSAQDGAWKDLCNPKKKIKSPGGWISTIVMNALRDERRRLVGERKRNPKPMDGDGVLPPKSKGGMAKLKSKYKGVSIGSLPDSDLAWRENVTPSQVAREREGRGTGQRKSQERFASEAGLCGFLEQVKADALTFEAKSPRNKVRVREVYFAHVVLGLKQEEVAKRLGISREKLNQTWMPQAKEFKEFLDTHDGVDKFSKLSRRSGYALEPGFKYLMGVYFAALAESSVTELIGDNVTEDEAIRLFLELQKQPRSRS